MRSFRACAASAGLEGSRLRLLVPMKQEISGNSLGLCKDLYSRLDTINCKSAIWENFALTFVIQKIQVFYAPLLFHETIPQASTLAFDL